MASIPKMEGTGDVVALIAAVLDARDGGGRDRAREAGMRAGKALQEDPSEFVMASGFVGAALAEMAAEALGTSPERVLMGVLTAGTGERGQESAVVVVEDEEDQ